MRLGEVLAVSRSANLLGDGNAFELSFGVLAGSCGLLMSSEMDKAIECFRRRECRYDLLF